MRFRQSIGEIIVEACPSSVRLQNNKMIFESRNTKVTLAFCSVSADNDVYC